MRGIVVVLVPVGVLSLIAPTLADAPPGPKPPVAKVVPTRLEQHGDVRIDNYHWLKDRDNPDVLRYLEAENAYTAGVMAPTKPLQETLFREFKARIKQTDVTVPYRKDDYYYYSKTEDKKNYPIYCRRKGSTEAPEQVMLDVNRIAEGHKFCSARPAEVNPAQDILAYGVDLVGRRFYTLQFKNLTTGELLPDAIRDVTGNMAWANDNKTLLYTKQDPTTLRSYRVYRHVLGTDPAQDELVFEEQDETFNTFVFKTKSKKYLMIVSAQTLSTEFRYLDADRPRETPRVFEPRRRDHEYGVDHYGDSFYIRTNHEAKNFRLMKTPVSETGLAHWTEVLPHRTDVLLEGFEIFRDYLVVSERKAGLLQLRIRPWSGSAEHYVDFGEPAYVAFPGANFQFDTAVLRFNYSSMTTPSSVYDYDMATREKKLLKRDEVLGGFDAKNYRTERILVTGRDGSQVPVSLVYRLPFKKDGLATRCWSTATARTARAWIRGSIRSASACSTADSSTPWPTSAAGEELGRAWYENGKLLHKKNTFNDFIDCTEHLVAAKYGDPKRVFAWGGSAGGLLVGAVVTMRPTLWAGAIAEVPFVDVVTTMLDDSIPLTTGEFDEWGDPKDKKYYDYMLSYSPYDQTRPGEYPNLLVTTGLNDSQVQYWEPAKWVAKLRAVKTDQHKVLLQTEMSAGHGGLSGRDDRYRERAFRYAFLLDAAGIRS